MSSVQKVSLQMLPIIFFGAVWYFFVHHLPPYVYWRDGGEFVLTAFFLDIAHPAGFPLYGQLSNFFALVPYGPIVWRVNAFSAFVAIAYGVSLYVLTKELLTQIFRVSRSSGAVQLLSFLPPIVFFSIPIAIKQSLQAEVYVLNALFISLLTVCYLRYRKTGDLRLVLFSCFLSGLALGNHVSIALFLLPCAVLMLIDSRRVRSVVLPGLLLGLFGLAIYAYIPVRANAYPPLNSGGAISTSRFVKLVTNERDSHVRPRDEASSTSGAQASGEAVLFFQGAVRDLSKMLNQAPIWALGLGALGLIFVFFRSWRRGLILLFAILSNWLFFRGWDPDPWIPIFGTLTLCASVFLFWSLRRLPTSLHLWYGIALVFAASILFVTPMGEALRVSEQIRDYDLPEQVALLKLRDAPSGSVMVTEPSWFITKYLRDIQGYRSDVSLVFVPQVLRPDYFAPVSLVKNSGERFSTLGLPQEDHASSMKVLSRLIGFTLPDSELRLEPALAFNEKLAGLSQLQSGGLMGLKQGEQGFYNTSFSQHFFELIRLVRRYDLTWKPLHADAVNYLEASINPAADILARVDQLLTAASLLERICAPLEHSDCSIVSLNNIAVYWMSSGELAKAQDLMVALKRSGRHIPAAMQQNILKLEKLLAEENPAETVL